MSSANCGARNRFSRPTRPHFVDLLGDPRCEAAVQSGHFLGALAQFAKKPRVLHRDDRLRREILQQPDLHVGERTHLLTHGCDNAEQSIAFTKRYGQTGARAGELDGHLWHGMVDLGQIWGVDKGGSV